MSSKKEQWLEWIKSRPESVQEIISKYPPGEYLIKEGAPYGVSCPGTKVILHSYGEDRTIGVIVPAENKLPAALEHERKLAIQHNKLSKLAEFHASNVKVFVDPQYLELTEAYKMGEE